MDEAPPWLVAVKGMTTVRSGSALRVIVTVCIPPSATAYEGVSNITVTVGSSSSVMVTVLLTGAIANVAGSILPYRVEPKLSTTLSSSSFSMSSVAVKVKVLEVCPLLKVTCCGTPE